MYLGAPLVPLLPEGPLRRLGSPALYLGVGALAALLAWVALLAGRDFSRWQTVEREHERGVQPVRGVR